MPKPKKTSGDFDDFEFAKESVDIEVFGTVSPSGAPVPLMTQDEVDFYNDKSNRYQSDNKFSNVSDLLELDRVLLHELMCFRWGQWMLAGGLDYNGNPALKLEQMVQLYSKEIRDLKSSLGVDKKSRDASKGANAADFIHNLTLRAKEFGIHRNEQVIKAYTLWKELQGFITLHVNSNEAERSEFNCRESDVIAWIQEKCLEFDEIDELFRKEKQQYWIRGELND